MTKLVLGFNFTQSISVLEYIPKVALILLKKKKKKQTKKQGELTLHSQSK